MSETMTFPTEIAKAIVKVAGEVKTLGKSEKNEHGNYNFVSIDKFLEFVGPLCAKHGLFFILNERDCEIIPRSTYTDAWGKNKDVPPALRVQYDVTIGHESGAIFGGITRNVTVLASGAQAYGSAQSYALKQFMRSLFQIPTGDKDDADYHAQSEIPQPAPRERPTAEEWGERRGADLSKMMKSNKAARVVEEMLADIESSDSLDALNIWYAQNSGKINALSDADKNRVRPAYAAKLHDFKTNSGEALHAAE